MHHTIIISHHHISSVLRKAPLKEMEQQFNFEFKKTKQSDSDGRSQLDATPTAAAAAAVAPVMQGAISANVSLMMADTKGGTEAKASRASGLDGTKVIHDVDAMSGNIVRPDSSGKQTVDGDNNNAAHSGSPDMNAENNVDGHQDPTYRSSRNSSSHQQHRKKRTKTAFQPLPVVDCVIFRGATGKMKQRLALTQSFATLFKMMSQNYGNRALAFKLGVVEEMSVIAVVCQDMPRVLDYFIWVVDVLYRDGFGDYLTPDDMEVSNVTTSCID